MAWRPEDEALLVRLRDELALGRLANATRDGRAQPHARAAGMITLLRQQEGGAAAVQAALEGDTRALIARTLPARAEGVAPQLLHHLALFHAGTARSLASEAAAESRAVEAWVASMGAWFSLGAERDYLRELVGRVSGSALASDAVERAGQAAPFHILDELGALARSGARELRPSARVAFLSLGRVGEACRWAGCADADAAKATRRAEAQLSAAVDEALAPTLAELTEASARGEILDRAVSLFERVVGVWHWTQKDPAVECIAIEQALPIAWELYRGNGWAGLRHLLEVIAPLADSLAERILRDPSQIAYAGPCAQVLVFRAEADEDAAQQVALVERALTICPSHRNGKIVLASLLCAEVLRRAELPAVDDAVLALDIERAEQLNPRARRLDEAKEALRRRRMRMNRGRT